MRIELRTACLLVACFICSPLVLKAQSPESSQMISVMELSIPRKALHDFQKGVELLAKKDAAASLPHFQRAVAEFGNFYEAYYKIGVADLNLWRLADAEQAYRRSIELSRGLYAQPLLALGILLGYEQKFAEAEEVTLKGLNMDPSSWPGRYSLACALFGLNQLEDAEENIREVLRLEPDSAEARLLLADILNRRKDYGALLEDLDEFLKLYPDHPSGVKVKALRGRTVRALIESQSSASIAAAQR